MTDKGLFGCIAIVICIGIFVVGILSLVDSFTDKKNTAEVVGE